MVLIVCFLQLFLVECRQTIVGACCWLLTLSDGPLLSARALPIEWSGPRGQFLCRVPLVSPIYDDICILVVGLNTIGQLVDFLNGHVFNTESEGFFHHKFPPRRSTLCTMNSGCSYPESLQLCHPPLSPSISIPYGFTLAPNLGYTPASRCHLATSYLRQDRPPESTLETFTVDRASSNRQSPIEMLSGQDIRQNWKTCMESSRQLMPVQ
jgi:hypothetical protein